MGLYPEISANLARLFGWSVKAAPAVYLIADRDRFLQMSASPYTIAFAAPHQNLMVIDYFQAAAEPNSLEATMRHELCHLILHAHIPEGNLPRWLDEGLCQWASDGLGELIGLQQQSALLKAAFSSRLVDLQTLEHEFPRDKDLLFLAYEESLSFINYLDRRVGQKGIRKVLMRLAAGETIVAAVSEVHSAGLDDLQTQWQNSLTRKTAWFAYLSYHLYEILFGLMGLITVGGFVRMILRKRAYVDDEDPRIPEDKL